MKTRSNINNDSDAGNSQLNQTLFTDIAKTAVIDADEIERTQYSNNDFLAAKIPICYICERALLKNGKDFLECYACQSQSHLQCARVTRKDLNQLADSGKPWCCPGCLVKSHSRHDLSTTSQNEDAEVCKHCNNVVEEGHTGLFCEDKCNSWYHSKCVGIKSKRYKELQAKSEPWTCNTCRMNRILNPPEVSIDIPDIMSHSVVWGEMRGAKEINNLLLDAYRKIAGWIPNLFLLPTGKAGKEFLAELTQILKNFAEKTSYELFSLTAFLVIIPLVLQKPSKNSKTAEHTAHVKRRLLLWREGKLRDLLRECEQIQKRLRSSLKVDREHTQKVFTRYMLEGKVTAAIKWLSTQANKNGSPVDLNQETLEQLNDKHPDPQDADEDHLLEGPLPELDLIRFEEIDETSIYTSVRNLKGSGGPSGLNSDGIKRILGSKKFGRKSKDLCYEVARVARRLCTEKTNPNSLKSFTACRLIPLSKDSGKGIRPIGIGEVLKRVIGKAVMSHLKRDVMGSAGTLQACSGQRAGCEAAIHSMRKVYEDPATECVLLIDATNAFNSMNRAVALHNIEFVCPPLAMYLRNTYSEAVNLFIRDKGDVITLQAGEGTTQGDPPASGFYAVNTVPIIEHLSNIEGASCHQAWFADDSTAAGKLDSVLKVWNELKLIGPGYGYFPNARKTVLIVKKDFINKAKNLFGDSGVIITTEGQRHLGAVIGSESYRDQFVSELVTGWAEQVNKLSEIAKSDPHGAYTAFTFGLMHKWSYFQRTIPNCSQLYLPLEEAIREKLIPAITGKSCSDLERSLFELPCRLGGLGIPNPVQTADPAFSDSLRITEPLIAKIMSKDPVLDNATSHAIEAKLSACKLANEIQLKLSHSKIISSLPDNLQRLTELNSEKGASIWLTTLPLQDCGFYLNKEAFRDALCMRYGWRINNMPLTCACGEKNTMNHALICAKGGFVNKRHNELRDIQAELLDEVCTSVTTEPRLQPLTGEDYIRGNKAEEARLDISAIGFWRPRDKVFCDVRVFDPNCKSYCQKDPASVYKLHENSKKAEYSDRVLNVERASFTPLIYSTTGGWGKEITRFNKHLARLIADKRNEEYSLVMAFMRRRLRFSLLRTTLEALRGCRDFKRQYIERAWKVVDLDFNLIQNLAS